MNITIHLKHFCFINLGCCARRDYTPLEDGPLFQSINHLNVEYVDIKSGYCYNRMKKIVFHIISICMLGVPYLAIHWSISLKLFLLMTPSCLSTADCVLVTVSTQNEYIQICLMLRVVKMQIKFYLFI